LPKTHAGAGAEDADQYCEQYQVDTVIQNFLPLVQAGRHTPAVSPGGGTIRCRGNSLSIILARS
jgi:hypothetical protein